MEVKVLGFLCLCVLVGATSQPEPTPDVEVFHVDKFPAPWNSSSFGCGGAFGLHINVTGGTLFALFTPQCSPSDTKTDTEYPLMVWSSGGPGCSGLLAAFAEFGPMIMSNSSFLYANPSAWTQSAHILFVDAPLGVGFSTGTPSANTSYAYAQTVHEAVTKFFVATPSLAKAELVLAGESYGGHWVPALANMLRPKFVLIGNGWINPSAQWSAELPYAESLAGRIKVPKLLLEAATKRCNTSQHQNNATTTLDTCGQMLNILMMANSDVDPTNIQNPCPNFSCFDKPSWDALTAMLSDSAVRASLGVKPSAPAFELCSASLGAPGVFDQDRVSSSGPEIETLLNSTSCKILLFAGSDDLVCDAGGVLATALSLKWPGSLAFAKSPQQTWTNSTSVKVSGNLAFALVANAGHQVPADNPVAALELVTQAINGWWQ